MKCMFLVITFLLISCSSHKFSRPSLSMAFDASKDHEVEATAIKRMEDNAVCFDISLKVKHPSSQSDKWTVAWLDKKKRFHLLHLQSRSPASTFEQVGSSWKKEFTTCESNVKFREVKALILEPKDDSSPGAKLQLRW